MRLGVQNQTIAKPKYQDDSYLVGKLTSICDVWEQLRGQMAADGHVLNLRKCEVWIPGADTLTEDQLTPDAFCVLSMLPRTTEGIQVMGGAAQGDYA